MESIVRDFAPPYEQASLRLEQLGTLGALKLGSCDKCCQVSLEPSVCRKSFHLVCPRCRDGSSYCPLCICYKAYCKNNKDAQRDCAACQYAGKVEFRRMKFSKVTIKLQKAIRARCLKCRREDSLYDLCAVDHLAKCAEQMNK